VVLDARSSIGCVYANGNNDGFVNDGTPKHPVLDCTEIAVDSPYYLFAIRDMPGSGKPYQRLHIPHSSVVAIHHYAKVKEKPMGFAPLS